MNNKENKNTYKEKEKNIKDICMMLEFLNEEKIECVRYFVRGVLGVPLNKGGNESYER